MTERNAVEFDNVNIVFGDRPQAALPLMDQGLARGPIKAETPANAPRHAIGEVVAFDLPLEAAAELAKA